MPSGRRCPTARSPRNWSTWASEPPHIPVLLEAVLQYLQPGAGKVVDATVGAGGHAEAILQADPAVRLVGLDRDPEALDLAARRLAPFGDRVTLVKADFRDLPGVLKDLDTGPVRGIVFDLGVSSMQFDRPEKGFSYREDGPLDMRMDPDQELTAATIVNTWDRQDLTRILSEYGEERWASRIAAFIVEARSRRALARTLELVEVIKAAVPAGARRRGGHPARRTFQALRIAVNDELGGLKAIIEPAALELVPGGRLVIISFHSLEDRVVKQEFRRMSSGCTCGPVGTCTCGGRNLLEVLTRKPVTPGEEERATNPRARSARLRAARRRPTD